MDICLLTIPSQLNPVYMWYATVQNVVPGRHISAGGYTLASQSELRMMNYEL